jgi:SAM-dependent methyltransferase
MTTPDQRQARSFGSVAERYDRYRPGYPEPAVTWALGDRPLRVADVGAGTGILSRLLERLGHDVVAVEPDDQMRARLAEMSPGIAALAGTAEELPLPDRSVDAVVVGQAYHWFDPDRAHREVARVLRPSGVFAVLWNDPDPEVAWTVRFAEIIDGPDSDGESDVDFGDDFGPMARAEFRHDISMTSDDLVAVATTRSPYLVGTPESRADLLDAISRLVASELAGRERFPMPYLTRVHRATVREGQ